MIFFKKNLSSLRICGVNNPGKIYSYKWYASTIKFKGCTEGKKWKISVTESIKENG